MDATTFPVILAAMKRAPFVLCLIALALCSHLAWSQNAVLSLKEAQTQFATADRELNAAWAEVKKALGESEFNTLKEEQRQWVQYRDGLALSPGYSGAPEDEVAARTSPEYFTTAAELATSRAEWLRALIRPAAEDATLTGLWSDSFGGRIEIVEKDFKLHFNIEVVRGPTAHTGNLAGTGSWNDPLGWFSDEERDNGKDDITNLAFILRGNKLEIVGANTAHYHGARAYFDGQYVKLKPLSPKAQALVLKAAKEAGKE